MRIRPARLASVLLGNEPGFPLVGFGPTMFLRLVAAAGAGGDLLMAKITESKGSLRCYEDFLEDLEKTSPATIDRLFLALFSPVYCAFKDPSFPGDLPKALSEFLNGLVFEAGTVINPSGNLETKSFSIPGKDKLELVLNQYLHKDLQPAYSAGVREKLFDGAVLEASKIVNERVSAYVAFIGLGERLSENAAVNALFDAKKNPFGYDLASETGQSCYKGIQDLLNGLFSYFRNPVAHAPRYIDDLGTFVRTMMFFSEILFVLDEAEIKSAGA